MNNKENTQHIAQLKDNTIDVTQIIGQVYEALTEKGYNPVNQLVGYILSEDPTYITTYKNARSMSGDNKYITSYKNARSLIMKAERDEIIEVLFEDYIKNNLIK